MTNSTGPRTRVPRFVSAKKARERSTVATPQPISRWFDRRPSASRLEAALPTAPSPMNRSQIRQASRSAVAGLFEEDRE